LSSAIIGKTPNYGLHLEEKRVPDIRIFVDTRLEEGDIQLIGKRTGGLLTNEVPIFTGLAGASNQDLKALGAAMAATGSVALFHVEGTTPEASMFRDMNLPHLIISPDDLRRWRKEEASGGEAELVVFGCPHCDVEELREIASLLDGKKVAQDKRLWVFVPRFILEVPDVRDVLDRITTAGGEVFADTCCVVAPLEELGLNGIMTDSGKAAVYLKNFCRTPPRLMSRKECVDYALE
jgi:predicted aconitase